MAALHDLLTQLEADQEQADRSQPLSRFVGREHELAALYHPLAQVEAGRGQVVGLVGEPGMGKSRLVYEFRHSLAGKRVTYLEGRCLSYGSAIPYLPILDVIRANCGILEADGPDTIVRKVRFGLQESGLDPDDGAPYVLQLLGVKEGTEPLAGLSPEAIKARTLEMLRHWCLRGSQRRPMILAIEDLHWIDTTSEEYLASLVESLAGAPVLLLCTWRPGYRPPWVDHSYVTQLALRRLAPQDSLSVVQSILSSRQIPDRIVQVILERAEGNPFFLEELAKAVAEQGEFHAESGLPDTVQGVLMARIDRLSEVPRRVLQTASVLGREFSLRLLDAIWDAPSPLAPQLLELKRLEFLYEQTASEEPVYVFKHALTQDVAYESLLLARRRALHAATGRALEKLYAQRLEEVYDRLAHHYAKTDEATKAVEYLTRFAEKAARLYANADAARALEEALAHVERLPAEDQDRRILTIVPLLAHSLYFLGRFDDTLSLLLKHQKRLERLREPALSGPYYFWLAHAYSYLSDNERAAENAHRALAEAGRCADEATMGKAYYVLARTGFWTNQFLQGVEDGHRAVELLERTEEWLWLGQSLWAVGLNYQFMGESDAALEAEGRARAIGETTGDPRIQTYADWASGWSYSSRGDWEAGIEACQRSLERSPDAVNTAAASGWLGYAHLESGDSGQAIVWLERGMQQWGKMGYWAIVGWYSAWLCEALRVDGQVEKARAEALKAIETCRNAKFTWGIAWAQRVLGRIALAGGVHAEAETQLTGSRDIFSAIQSRFEVGRTYLALAELALARRNPEETAAFLREAHALFTAVNATKYVQRTEQLAAATKPASPADPRGAEPSTQRTLLTRREREVAVLIAQGMTDRQIAENLTITEGTVGIHVVHILNKLGFRSRAQVAVWVAEHGLLRPHST